MDTYAKEPPKDLPYLRSHSITHGVLVLDAAAAGISESYPRAHSRGEMLLSVTAESTSNRCAVSLRVWMGEGNERCVYQYMPSMYSCPPLTCLQS